MPCARSFCPRAGSADVPGIGAWALATTGASAAEPATAPIAYMNLRREITPLVPRLRVSGAMTALPARRLVRTRPRGALSRVRGQERARLRQLGSCGALPGELHQSREVALGLGLVAALRGRLRGAVEATEALGLAPVRRLELLEGIRGTLQLEQHLAEQLACGHDPRRRHDVFLVLVLDVRRPAHETDGFVGLALRERRPARGAEPADLHLGRPVLA